MGSASITITTELKCMFLYGIIFDSFGFILLSVCGVHNIIYRRRKKPKNKHLTPAWSAKVVEGKRDRGFHVINFTYILH